MRNKIIAVVTLIALISTGVASPLFAVSDQQKLANIDRLEANMSDFEKIVVYNETRKSAVGGFLLNSMIGFGAGSFALGDNLNGGIALGLDLGSAVLMGAATAMLSSARDNFTQDGFNQYFINGREVSRSEWENAQSAQDSKFTAAQTMLIAGGIIAGGSRIYQMITPWIYADKFNQKLKDAFHVTEFNVVPTVTADGKIAPTAVVGMAF